MQIFSPPLLSRAGNLKEQIYRRLCIEFFIDIDLVKRRRIVFRVTFDKQVQISR